MADTSDVIVIGLGPGGEAITTQLAKAGLSVTGVDSRLVGGECPYYACVPTKMMIRAAHTLNEARTVGRLSGTAEVTPDWSKVAGRIREEATANWDDTVAVQRLEAAGARFVRGHGRIAGPGRVVVSTSDGEVELFATKGIVLNPGTDPAVPDIPGLAGTPFWTNREAVPATEVPASLIVLGGGPVGCEFAQVFRRFGAEVTLLQSQSRLLPLSEPEASELLAARFAHEGVTVHTGAQVTGAKYADGFTIEVNGGNTLTAQGLLVAAGRHRDLAALGVGAYGLDETARGVPVDERMRAADGLWAIGDITGKGAFTHMSMYQAAIAAATSWGSSTRRPPITRCPR